MNPRLLGKPGVGKTTLACAAALATLDFINDPEAYDRQEQLRAMDIAANALILFAHRHADRAEELAASEKDPLRQQELQEGNGEKQG